MKYVICLFALLMSLGCLGVVFRALETGRCYWRPGFVERGENPLLFRTAVGFYIGMAILFILFGLLALWPR